MKWRSGGRSADLEDNRGKRVSAGAMIGGGGGIIGLILALVFGLQGGGEGGLPEGLPGSQSGATGQ